MKDNLVVALLCTLAIGAAGITEPALVRMCSPRIVCRRDLQPKRWQRPSLPAPSGLIESPPRSSIWTGVDQASLRGDGASMTTLDAAHDKAYTVLTLGAPRNEDSSGAIAQRIVSAPSAGGLAKLPHILLTGGALRIKVGDEAIAAI